MTLLSILRNMTNGTKRLDEKLNDMNWLQWSKKTISGMYFLERLVFVFCSDLNF